MVEYSLSLSKKSFGDIISLLEKQKKKYEEQYPAFPKDCIEIFKGGEMQTDSAEICIAMEQTTFFPLIYAARTLLFPKGFHCLSNLFGLKRIQENALDISHLNKRSSGHHRNRDFLDSRELLMHYTVQTTALLCCPEHTKGRSD